MRMAGLMLAGAVAIATVLMPVAAGAQRRAERPQSYDERGRYGGYDARGNGPRDRDPRRAYVRRCDRGTGGTILGAIAGGLIGNAGAGRRDRELGTIVGGGAGALSGRAIARDC